MRTITPITGNTQKLDGGAMFGHVPKALWSQWLQPDDQNRITLACRAMLVKEANRNILLETGIGAFFEPKMRERYGVVEQDHVLLHSLQQQGLSHEDIDIVILSHLHFDHAGGLLSAWKEGNEPQLLFPNATYLVGKEHWERANQPHVRDKASFVPELNKLLAASNRLVLVDNERNNLLGDDYQFLFSNGHTPGLMHTIVGVHDASPIIFTSDLIPGTHWVHLPVTMGYDRSPELLIEEKRQLLEKAIKINAKLFYTHDPEVVMSSVKQTADGKFIVC